MNFPPQKNGGSKVEFFFGVRNVTWSRSTVATHKYWCRGYKCFRLGDLEAWIYEPVR